MSKEKYLPRKRYSKEKVIENIDPVLGVTPSQLLKQCEILADIIIFQNGFFLDETQRADAIHQTVVNVYQKMEQGKLDKFNYDIFKTYLFVSLRSSIIRQFQIPKKVKRLREALDITQLQPEELDSYEMEFSSLDDVAVRRDQYFKKALEQLTGKKKMYLNEVLEGSMVMEVARKYGICKEFYRNIVVELKKKIEILKRNDFLKSLKKSLVSLPEFNERVEFLKNKGCNSVEIARLMDLVEVNGDSVSINHKHLNSFATIREKIIFLKSAGLSNIQIKTLLKCTLSTVYKHCGFRKKSELPQVKFPRNIYYTLTEAHKKFNISPRKLKLLVIEKNLQIIRKHVDLGDYAVSAWYLLKTDIDALNLPLRN